MVCFLLGDKSLIQLCGLVLQNLHKLVYFTFCLMPSSWDNLEVVPIIPQLSFPSTARAAASCCPRGLKQDPPSSGSRRPHAVFCEQTRLPVTKQDNCHTVAVAAGIPIDLVAGTRDGVIPPHNICIHYEAMKAAGLQVQ